MAGGLTFLYERNSMKSASITSAPAVALPGRGVAALVQSFLKYVVVGGIAFIVDWGLLKAGVSSGMDYRLATALGFTGGLVTNYLLCIHWVWRGTQARSLRDLAVFTLVGIGGLVLTELLMWLAVDFAHLRPTLAKLPIAGVVLVWNFGLRRLFVFFR